MLQAEAVDTVMFYSRSMGLRLIRKREISTYTATGARVVNQGEVVADFGENGPGQLGQYEIPADHGLMVDEDGVERTTVEWLRQHPEYNLLFFESGNEPGLLRPTPAEFHAAVIAAATAPDEVELRALLDAERDSHNRDELVAVAQLALRGLGVEPHEASPGAG